MESHPSLKPAQRIAIDARFYRKSTAGVGRYTRALIAELQKLDTPFSYTVILTPADYAEWPKSGVPKNWAVKVLDVVHFTLGEQTKLLSYLNEQQFDLVHFTQFNHPIRYRGKAVTTIHDLILHFFPPRPLWHPRTWAYRFTMRHAADQSVRVIVPSQSTKNDLVRHLHTPPEKVAVTLEGVEPNFTVAKPDAKLAETLRRKYGLTKPFLLFINAWRPHKGLPELVAAFLEVQKKHDVQLLVGGQPNASFPEVIAAVEQAQSQTPNILTPGFIDDRDLVPLYNLAEAFILPTHYEGFGIPGLEAISCGCPVISAKNSSLPEALGEAALYFETGNAHDLAKQITTLLDRPKLRERLRQKGLDQAKQFSFAKMAKETLAVYHSVLSQPD